MEGMNGGQQKECGLCGGRERQTRGAGRQAGGVGAGMRSLDDKVGGSRGGTRTLESVNAHTSQSQEESCGASKGRR